MGNRKDTGGSEDCGEKSFFEEEQEVTKDVTICPVRTCSWD